MMALLHGLRASFAGIIIFLMSYQDPSMSERQASVERNTNETRIKVSVNLDGSGKFKIQSGLPFLEHMLEQVARHGLIDMDIVADGDLQIDAHHTVEDLGITLGQAVDKALSKTGIRRYGHAYVPLDEALSRVVIDFSGRPGLEYNIPFKRSTVGDFDVDLFFEFFQGFVNHAKVSLHIDNMRGNNAHHQIETVFKAFGRAVRMAIELDPRMQGTVPSTKGTLTG
jgi:imidazoleglycerol-phosphate dehydratase